MQLKSILHGEMAKRFLQIKEQQGFSTNSDTLRMVITRAYEELFGKP